MFKDAKVGDRVWSILDGWGEVAEVSSYGKGEGYKRIKVRTPQAIHWYEENGVLSVSSITGQTLFWDEVKIIPPLKPKRKVKKVIKVIEGWVHLGEDYHGNEYYIGRMFRTREQLMSAYGLSEEKHKDKVKFIRHEHEVEED